MTDRPPCPEPTAVAHATILLELLRLEAIRALMTAWRACVDGEGYPNTARRNELAHQLEHLVKLDAESPHE